MRAQDGVQRRMHADTDAIRGYAGATTDLASDLRAAAAALSHDVGPTVTDAFGPVGARFARALADATEALMTTVTTLGDDVTAYGTATAAAAGQYDHAETRARANVAQVVV
jgi:hypothetical protein